MPQNTQIKISSPKASVNLGDFKNSSQEVITKLSLDDLKKLRKLLDSLPTK